MQTFVVFINLYTQQAHALVFVCVVSLLYTMWMNVKGNFIQVNENTYTNNGTIELKLLHMQSHVTL